MTDNQSAISGGLDRSLADIRGGYAPARDALTGAYGTGTAATNAGYDAAGRSLGTGFDLARSDLLGGGAGALNRGAFDAQRALGAGASGATDAVMGGADAARGYYDSARGAYDPLAGLGAKYGGASTLALNALGANGADAQGAARSAFSASPAYDFNLTQGLDAINRARNARGMANSGNTDRDAQVFGAGLASNEYDKWLAGLNSYVNPELSATSGAAAGRSGVDLSRAGFERGVGTDVANIRSGLGRDVAGVATGLGTGTAGLYGSAANLDTAAGTGAAGLETQRAKMLSDLAQSYGGNTANAYTGEGTSLAGLETGAANARVGAANTLAPGYSQTYKTAADAELAGSGNIWNLGLNLARLGTGAAGGGAFTGAFPGFGDSSGNPGSIAYGSNPFTQNGVRNPAYGY